MKNLDFLTGLRHDDFNVEVDFAVPDFLVKNMVTVIYANGGSGKSWLAAAVAKYAQIFNERFTGGMDVVYIDMDNGVLTLKERGINVKLINNSERLIYVSGEKLDIDAQSLMEQIELQATGKNYKDTLFIIDSLRDLGDVKSDAAAMRIGDFLKRIRNASGTVLALHHSTKNGAGYDGSNNLRNSVDNMFKLTKVDADVGELRFLLEVDKARVSLGDLGLRVFVDDLELSHLQLDEVKLSPEDKDFIKKIEEALEVHVELNKTALLDAVGYKKDDKTARVRLDRFDGIHWKSEKVKGVYTYSLV
jgi:hypothetical protein